MNSNSDVHSTRIQISLALVDFMYIISLQNESHSFKVCLERHIMFVPIIMATVVEVLGHVVQTNVFKNPFS